MKRLLKEITDKGTFYILVTRLFIFIKGPLSLIFIAKFLTKVEQGVWYTYGSLAALYLLAELGFATILSQYVSHEYAHLEFKDGKVFGEHERKERLFILVRFAIKLYSIIIPSAMVILLLVGFFYFRNEAPEIFYCWILYTLSSGFTLFLSFLQSVYQGLDKVKDVQKQVLIGQIVLTLLTWTMLSLGLNIWSMAVSSIFANILMSMLLLRVGKAFWQQVLSFKNKKKFHWGTEMIKLQGRYAISWLSGYVIFNLITPVIYKYISPEVAGQYGFTITAINAINGFSGSWFDSKAPQLNILVSRREVSTLNNKFMKLFLFSLLLSILGYISFYALSFLLENIDLFNNRFLEQEFILLIIAAQIPNIIIINLARYLRAYKEEPFIYVSILSAVTTAVSAFYILPNYGFTVFLISLIGFALLISLPLASLIFYSRKKEYDQMKVVGV